MRNAVGLDISQDTFDAAVIINGCRKSARFNNNAKGFENLKAWLDSFGVDDLHICMEATGNYFEDVADYIGRYYKVSVINPYKISEYGKSRFQRTKTDKQDARLIAEYCHTAMPKDLPLRKTISNGHSRLKRVLALYNQLMEERTAQKNRLKATKDDFVIQVHKAQIDCISKQIMAVRAEIDKIIKQDSNLKAVSENLQSIPAIGSLTAAVLANHLLGADFQTSNQFAAFSGLAPQKRQSGTSVKGKDRLTKYGNRKVRAALFMPAMVALRCGYLPDLVQRLKSRKKPTMVILGAIMRKLAVIAFNLYKKGEKYDPNRYQVV
ncbi:IS110 family transposase [Neisseria dentiae]|uniref:IS110 family transposase n=1 Tax=Neisseria dentiae TaxID=194197 RepID=UPI0035A199FA